MLLPKSIQIQTVDDCNRRCPWCPNSYRAMSGKLMDLDVYMKILNDLHDVGYRGNLHPYLAGEPLLDDRLPDLISVAREMFPENIIFISTNGILLTKERVVELFNAGLTWMGISHYDESTKHLYGLDKKYKIAHTTLNQLRHTFFNFGGSVGVGCVSPSRLCDWVFEKACINYRGDVVLCCADYFNEIVFGNVMENGFQAIYNSSEYNRYRDAHKTGGGKTMPLCMKCNRVN